ncbi:CPBP family intramembrane glutamic endopeptidase [Limnohabitans radicicola]|uniref:CPBP family intramembrane metalloprotease n=1 Tax=Limnohabitans radicicola TaxID=2771427 RepID=A0A927FET9_9BURK|nr:CPBP family intramembrane glutamic endopeptidase [Limnohabitans radicicola]MBD8050109.1 CPBP family intramembrane metalloprotease [Limnohabitans radicicola]
MKNYLFSELKSFWVFLISPIEFKQQLQQSTKSRFKRSLLMAMLALPMGWALWKFVTWLPELGFYLPLKDNDPTLHRGAAVILLSSLVVAPILEEWVFRWPLLPLARLRYFRAIFYVIALMFGMIHMANYEADRAHWLFSLLIVSPQLVAGLCFAYVRLTCGIWWAVGSHALYNAIGLMIQD